MPTVRESEKIAGVYIVEFDAYGDERGQFMETFRKTWLPQRSWDIVQMNRSESMPNVLRGLHYHFNQVDYWHVVKGSIRAGLLDIRPDSPTFKQNMTLEMHADKPFGLFIPIGVAHGFVSLTDIMLLYIVDNYYNKSDEFGVAWNDPDVGPDWGVANPMVSERDRTNPFLRDIPLEQLPRLANG